MHYAVLGTGSVGNTIATKLISLGHEVTMGSREANNPKAAAWKDASGAHAHANTFSAAAQSGEVIFNCTAGTATLAALELAGAKNLAGKVLVDVSNPLDFSKGFPPTLDMPGHASLGERVQAAYPEARVVKTLNTLAADLMVDPRKLAGGEHDVFVSGNDRDAKAQVRALLEAFGWKNIHDLGDISTARGTENYLPLWLRLYGALGTGAFNLRVVR